AIEERVEVIALREENGAEKGIPEKEGIAVRETNRVKKAKLELPGLLGHLDLDTEARCYLRRA
ncbi:hypothetical protein RUND412_011573, partial [Rhizina undulata]